MFKILYPVICFPARALYPEFRSSFSSRSTLWYFWHGFPFRFFPLIDHGLSKYPTGRSNEEWGSRRDRAHSCCSKYCIRFLYQFTDFNMRECQICISERFEESSVGKSNMTLLIVEFRAHIAFSQIRSAKARSIHQWVLHRRHYSGIELIICVA